ncbi:site-specific integrase [Mesoflavibacter zeaxanthinifaciens]|uniref:site-specific integrase n=1 Tax=Mesoflavibacter zeaxanthinifaciens TaxID=393060 RepID=UPI003A91B1D4
MTNSNTFSILFWINSSRVKNNQAEIYARISVNSKRTNLSLKTKVDPNLWDANKKRLKGASRRSKQINLYLEEVNAQLFQIYQDLKFKGQLISAQLIKAHYTGEATDKGKTLLDTIDYHNKKIANTLTAGSIRNFGVTESYVIKFLKSKKHTNDIYLKQLNYEFLTDFQMYLSKVWPAGHPKALSHNTIMKHIQRLRKIVTLAFHLEWVDKDPFVRWRMSFEKTNREFLSESELYDLEIKEFISERLDRVRDLFVFSCYTGISYVDVMSLTSENVVRGIDGANWIMTKRQKTNMLVKVPLLPQASEIINKYKEHPMTCVSESLLPRISNEKLNMYLKEVANFVGIKKNLTFHMARHTFATTITLSNGVPIETVSKILGHSKITTTQIYARVLETKVSTDMHQLKTILEIKKNKDTIEKETSNNSNTIKYKYNYV